MNEKRKSSLPFLLAMASLVLMATLFTLCLLFFAEGNTDLAYFLLLAGWIPGLILAIVSFAMLNRLRSRLEKVATVFLCSLTILAIIIWALFIRIQIPPR
jgi:hypothetical protein